MKSRIFTSESVTEGHPDKVCDQISDAILDEIIGQDPDARVACETLTTTGLVLVSGEVTTDCYADVQKVVRRTLGDIGYTDPEYGLDYEDCSVLTSIHEQSPDIAQGVDESKSHEQGAGDQGLMFGYAENSTDELMPAPIMLAHQLVRRQAELLLNGSIKWLRPDAKSQVSCIYESNKIVGIDAVVLSTQHDRDITLSELREAVKEEIIKPILPEKWLTAKTQYHINPTGNFEIGGPVGDAGLTGRKIIVDTYGGMARHGGGAFSGKDPSKVDRSASYATRYVAKNIVAAGIADRCEIQVSYAIGVAEPTSISVDTFGTGKISNQEIVKLIREHFDLRPKGLIAMLNLKRPIYQQTASYGHFGRAENSISWEKTDRANLLK